MAKNEARGASARDRGVWAVRRTTAYVTAGAVALASVFAVWLERADNSASAATTTTTTDSGSANSTTTGQSDTLQQPQQAPNSSSGEGAVTSGGS